MEARGHHQREKGGFTHFASLPFIRKTHRQSIDKVQGLIEDILCKSVDPKRLRKASNLLMHLTLGMLSLPDNETQAKAVHIFDQMRGDLDKYLSNTSLTFSKIGYFTRFNHREKMNEVTVIYLEPEKDQSVEKLKIVNDQIIRQMMKAGIVREKDFGRMHVNFNKDLNRFQLGEYHLTLFRVQGGVLEDESFLDAIHQLKQLIKPLTIECDFVDISTRYHYDETKFYTPLTRVRLESHI